MPHSHDHRRVPGLVGLFSHLQYRASPTLTLREDGTEARVGGVGGGTVMSEKQENSNCIDMIHDLTPERVSRFRSQDSKITHPAIVYSSTVLHDHSEEHPDW